MAEKAALIVEIKGLDKLKKAFKQYPRISEPIFMRALNATAAVFAKNTLKGDPVPWRTGMLTQTFTFTPAKSGDLKASWRPTRHYAPYVEFGTKRMQARPYMERILEKATPEVNKLLERALEQVNEAIAKA